MESAVIGLFAETSIHPGTESTGGLIDLPVAREAATGYPVIPGTSLKGSLRNKAGSNLDKKALEDVFGVQDRAGGIAVTDARLLLLPVRSLISHYAWVTSPYLVERFARDKELAGGKDEISLDYPEGFQAFASEGGELYLEELTLQKVPRPDIIGKLTDAINPLIYHESVKNRLNKQLVIVNDTVMAYFTTYCLSVQARNKLNENTKISENLWYEETLPADSLFYFLLLQRPEVNGSISAVIDILTDNPYVQVGGNETVGQGWCAASMYKGEA